MGLRLFIGSVGAVLGAIGLVVACVGDDPVAVSPGAADAASDGPPLGCDGGTTCGSSCVDTTSNAAHCGRCDRSCRAGTACIGGRCADDVVDVAAMRDLSCAVLAVGDVYCWGSNQAGGTGTFPSTTDPLCGQTRCKPTPSKVPLVADIVQVVVSLGAACALRRDGNVFCWGNNHNAQLGHALASDSTCSEFLAADGGVSGASAPCSAPRQVVFPEAVKVVQIVASRDVVCARTASKDLYCWGDNGGGAIGNGAAGGLFETPLKLAAIAGDATDVSTGASFSHVCAVRAGGNIWCWGFNKRGELGHAPGTSGDGDCSGQPCNATPQPTGAAGTSVAVTQQSTCALAPTGGVSCFGNNDQGQLGILTTTDMEAHPTPAALSTLPPIARIERGVFTRFAITSAGAVWAWGWNAYRAAGKDDTGGVACQGLPGKCITPAAEIPALAGTLRVSGGEGSGLAAKEDGTVVAFGLNDFGQLGHAPFTAGDVSCGGPPCAGPTPVVIPR